MDQVNDNSEETEEIEKKVNEANEQVEQKQKEFLRNKCYSLNRDAANFYYQQITKNQESLQFLKAKQILPETVKQYALGYAPDEQSALYNYLKQKMNNDDMLEIWNKLFRTGNFRFRTMPEKSKSEIL